VSEKMQTVEIRFPGELVAAYTSWIGTRHTLYRTPDDRFRVHADDGEQAWLEAGRLGEGLTEDHVSRLWPAFFERT
jgi:hypothetical protein